MNSSETTTNNKVLESNQSNKLNQNNIDNEINRLSSKLDIINELKNNKTEKFLPGIIKSFIKDDEYSEAKENLIILLESVKKSQLRMVFFTFITYNSIKYVLWNYGYFALFFYYTRMMSVALAGISCYLVDYNFKLKIEKYGLKGYYNKMKEDKNKVKINRINDAVRREILLNNSENLKKH